ncbi:MAG: Unknown protein [uncultured Aureispira sp.]|uniref:Uncharacterized protein n=1 Tax=uncultured Aureispira sp. TaxID=1331704 RepID=A0A6S6S2Y7_9BACT|nr:MAG: Unknown protein [uncultured Aureispira sp.]
MHFIKNSSTHLLILLLLASNLVLISKDLLELLPSISSPFHFSSYFDVKNTVKGKPLAISITSDKMNVLYLGVNNPISINAFGKDIHQFTLRSENKNVAIEPTTAGKYTVRVFTEEKVVLIAKHLKSQKESKVTFNVKKIPTPIVRRAKKSGGLISSEEMKGPAGLSAQVNGFDFPIKCHVQSYTLFYTRKNKDAVRINGLGGRFTGKALSAIKQAKSGDSYAFVNVKVRCTGDKSARNVNSLIFLVK